MPFFSMAGNFKIAIKLTSNFYDSNKNYKISFINKFLVIFKEELKQVYSGFSTTVGHRLINCLNVEMRLS